MTDKEKFRKEVERLKSQLLRGACSSQIAMETRCKEEAYNEVLAILDTMQEAPVSEKKCMFTKDSYTDEDRKVLCEDCKEKCEYNKKEEPVSEDLEKENKIEILADIIFNAAKYGYMPYDTQDEYCAMEIAKENIDKFIVPKKQEGHVSEDKMTISKEWFEHCKKSWYNEGYIDGEYNRDRQFENSVSEDLEEACEQLAENARKRKAETSTPFFSQTDYRQGVIDGAKWKVAKLMENVIDVTVHIDAGGYPYIPQMEFYDYDKDVPLAKAGDKYKVVLIKDE